ncbi:MAG: TRAP transporter large permease [Firmicutes bacterium]|nr:TRAP transporter large permease [Bacillota bacterium]
MRSVIKKMSHAVSVIETAIPFFILAGELMNHGGLSKRLLKFASTLVGHLWGGLAQVVVLVSMFFAGVSGSAVANSSAVGTVLIDAMDERGYDKAFAAAVIAASGTIGILIPPSIPMVVYGWLANESIGKLLLAGAIPGLMLGIALMILCAVISRKNNYPREPRASFSMVLEAGKSTILALLTPVVIIGGILSGIVTPTEAAVIAVVWSFLIGKFVYHDLEWKMIPTVLKNTVISTAGVMIIIAAANIFAWLIALGRVPEQVAQLILSITTSKFGVLLLMNLVLLLTGMIIDLSPAVMILTPILLPVAKQVGVDPIHFGALMVVNLGIGLYTPPVGTCLFVASALAKLKMEEVVKKLAPFYVVALVVLILVTYVPGVSLWLPSLMK